MLNFFKNVSEEQWEQKLLAEATEILEKKLMEWCAIVNKIGMDEEDKNNWISIFKERLNNSITEIVGKTTIFQNNIEHNIEELVKQSKELCKDLHVQIPEHSAKLSLQQVQKYLIQKVEGLKKILNEKKLEISKLLSLESDLCKCLGKMPKLIKQSPLPTTEEISDFMKYLSELENTKFKREKKFIKLKYEIVDIGKELQVEPKLDFERLVILSDDAVFIVTDHNMTMLKEMHQSFNRQLKEVKKQMSELRDRIKSLSETLSEDLGRCDVFLQKNQGSSMENLASLKREFERLLKLRKTKIGVFVKKYREELVSLWNKCYYSENERQEFPYFNVSLITDDLLKLHEIEVGKLKAYYSENSEIFKLIEKWSELHTNLSELEERASKPDRYKNRGGTLLQEEKQRNTISKTIPKLEKRLLELAKQYEERVGKTFLVKGQTIKTMIEERYTIYEQNKQLKSSARKQQIENKTPTYTGCLKSASSTPNLAASTPRATASALKQKLASPLLSSTKRPRILQYGIPTAPPKIVFKTAKAAKRLSTTHKKRRQKRLSFNKTQKNDSSNSSTNHYDAFEVNLINKQSCRSTLAPEATSSTTNCLKPQFLSVPPHHILPNRTPKTSKKRQS